MATPPQPLTPSERFRARMELKNILIDRIETLDNPDIFYGDLVTMLSIEMTADDRRLFELLDEISEQEFSQGRGFLSVIVIKKATKRPGEGFFAMAKKCGEDVSDREAFYESAKRDVRDNRRD